jgi:hypothetical protein
MKEGEGTGVIVGAEVGLGTCTGVAGAEHEANKTASKLKNRKRRSMLSKGKIETVCEGAHYLL